MFDLQERDSSPDIDDDSDGDLIDSVLNDSLSQELVGSKTLEEHKNNKNKVEQEPENKMDNHFENILGKCSVHNIFFVNLLQPGVAFLYPLKTSENLKVF